MTNHNARQVSWLYKHSYMLLPIPIVASGMFAAYVVYTGDDKIDAYCTIAKHEAAYGQQQLKDYDFEYRAKETLAMCKAKDKDLDQADGRNHGRVRWFTCKGTTCGPGWENFLAEK